MKIVKVILIGLGVLMAGLIGLSCVGIMMVASEDSDVVEGSDLSTNKDNPPIEDVEIVACDVDEFDFVTGQVRITNHSSKPSDYFISIKMVGPDGATQTGDALSHAINVNPGGVAIADIAGTGAIGSTCELTEVERLAS